MKRKTYYLTGFLMAIISILMISIPAFASTVSTNIHEYLEAYYGYRYSIHDVNMGGNTYENALCFDSYNNVTAEADFNLEGHFKSMSFYVGHQDSTSNLQTRTVSIYTDDVLAYEKEIHNGDLPAQGSIILTGVKQLKLIVSGSSGTFKTCLGGIQVESDGFTREQKLKPVTSNLLANIQPYNSHRYRTMDQISMGDQIWKNPLCFDSFNGVTANAYFNLEGNYRQLSFYAGHRQGGGTNNRRLTVYGDNGAVLYENMIAYNQLPLPVVINVTGVHQLLIQIGGSSGTFNTVIGGANLVSNGIVRSISLDPKALVLNDNNKSYYLKAEIVPSDASDKRLEWTTSDKSVATVSNEGLVTGVGPGECTITVKTVSGGYTAVCNVSSSVTRFEKKANSITAKSLKFTAKKKAQFASLEASADGGAKLYYSSSNKKVKVSSKGVVTVAKNYSGIAVITIRSAETDLYKSASKKVTIKILPARPVVSAVKNTGKRQMTVQWTPLSYVTGYQIQYSLKSDFSGAVKKTVTKAASKKLTLNKLTKGKKYYVRMRAYVKSGSKTLYSEWSKRKYVKITM